MGDPRKKRKKYATPRHPWQSQRLEKEKEILYNYSLKNKKEIWRMQAVLTKYQDIAKRLANDNSESGKKEKEQLANKLYKMGLTKANATIDDILSLNVKDILNRRLQSMVCNQKFARTMKQARQFIIHGHILIGDKRIDSPSYIVPLVEEAKISFSERSPLNSNEHPERVVLESKKGVKKAKEDKKEEKPRRERPKRLENEKRKQQ
ncbi:30S ribosomal protein S4 [Candidatus Woesearchaeota archaeon]|nr:30S ribosomal protein S4 [Candidatus Woesearchaeota archaeon]